MLQCRGNVWIQGKMIADICWPKSGCSMLQLHLLLGFAVPECSRMVMICHDGVESGVVFFPLALGIKRGAAGWFTHSNLNFRGDFPCKFSPSLRRWGPRCFSRMFCAFLARHVPLSTMAKPACVRFGGSETGPGVTSGYVKTWLLGSVIVQKFSDPAHMRWIMRPAEETNPRIRCLRESETVVCVFEVVHKTTQWFVVLPCARATCSQKSSLDYRSRSSSVTGRAEIVIASPFW